MKVLSRLAATLFSVSACCTLVLFLIANPLAHGDAEVRLAGSSEPGASAGVSLQSEWLVLAGCSLFFGLLWLFSVLGRSLASPRSKARATSSGVDAKRPLGTEAPAEAGAEELLAQFESNWKTFATYTQDILHHKLQELEAAPQRSVQELRDQLCRVSEALVQVRCDLDSARTEARTSSDELAEQVSHILQKDEGEQAPHPESQDLLCKIERDFNKVSNGFAELQEFVQRLGEVSDSRQGPAIEERVTEVLETFKGRLQEQADAFGGAIDHAWKRNETLLEELARLKEAEEALRLDLAEAAVREEALHRDVEAERTRGEAAARERELAHQREADALETVRAAQEREREALKRIGALEEALGDLGSTPDPENVAVDALRRELTSLRATFEMLREEKEHSEEDSSDPGEGGDALLQDAQREMEKLLGEIQNLKVERDECRARVSPDPPESDRPEIQRLEQELAEREKQCRSLEEECQHHRTCLEKAEAEWSRRHADTQVKLITAREQLEGLGKELDELRREADGIRRLQEVLVEGGIPSAVVAANPALEVFTWNPAAEEIWDRKAESVLGQALSDTAATGVDPALVDRARQALDEKKRAEIPRMSFKDAQGRTRYLQGNCDPILGPAGQALGVVLCVDDVTDETESEIDSRCQAVFSQSLARSLPVALVVLDARKRVVSWNRVAETILGISEEAALGKELFVLETPFAKAAFRKYFERASKGRESRRIRVRMEVKGIPANYVLTLSPFVGGDEQVRGTILLLQPAVEPAPSAR